MDFLKRWIFSLLLIVFLTVCMQASAFQNLFYILRGDNNQDTGDRSALINFEKHYKTIDILVSQAYRIDQHGNVKGYINPEALSFAKKHDVKIMPMVTNIGYDAKKTHKFLSNSFAINRAIRTILDRCRNDHCYGVQIDFESVSIRDYTALINFYKKLIKSFHQAGLVVSFAVAPLATHNPRQFYFLRSIYQSLVSDTKNRRATADFLSIMAYDEHCEGTNPGPNASLAWVDEAVRLALNYLPPQKISLGIPDYSYLWYVDKLQTIWGHRIKKGVEDLSFIDVYDLMNRKHFNLKWDSDEKVDYAIYREIFFMHADKSNESRYCHPQWLIEKIQQDWPQHWEAILDANNSKPSMWLRVNRSQISREDFLQLLKKNNIPVELHQELKDAVRLPEPMPVEKIPGFAEGLFCVQDGSGQKVVDFLDLAPKQKILDACAAPGNKTSHILEVNPELNVLVAIDQDATRLPKIKQNIDRLRLNHQKVHLILEDASHVKQWWDGTLFDRILLDAPCSATGVIRRHPDIKLLRQFEDIEKLAQQQQHILNSLWQTLASKGKLIYTTCSILSEENDKIIGNFLNTHKNAKIKRPKFDWGIKLQYGNQLLPEINGMDGFYYCVISKA